MRYAQMKGLIRYANSSMEDTLEEGLNKRGIVLPEATCLATTADGVKLIRETDIYQDARISYSRKYGQLTGHKDQIHNGRSVVMASLIDELSNIQNSPTTEMIYFSLYGDYIIIGQAQTPHHCTISGNKAYLAEGLKHHLGVDIRCGDIDGHESNLMLNRVVAKLRQAERIENRLEMKDVIESLVAVTYRKTASDG